MCACICMCYGQWVSQLKTSYRSDVSLQAMENYPYCTQLTARVTAMSTAAAASRPLRRAAPSSPCKPPSSQGRQTPSTTSTPCHRCPPLMSVWMSPSCWPKLWGEVFWHCGIIVECVPFQLWAADFTSILMFVFFLKCFTNSFVTNEEGDCRLQQ